jgi:hypothetical protein
MNKMEFIETLGEYIVMAVHHMRCLEVVAENFDITM